MTFSIRTFLIVLILATVSVIASSAETFRIRQPETNPTQILKNITIDKPSPVTSSPINLSFEERSDEIPRVAHYPQTSNATPSPREQSAVSNSTLSGFGNRNSNQSSSSRRGSFGNSNDPGMTKVLSEQLPEPARKKVTDPAVRKQLEKISELAMAAKNGEQKPPETNTTDNNAANDTVNTTHPAVSETNAASGSAAIIAKSIFPATDNPKEWLARLQNGSTVSVKKIENEFYQFDAATGKIGTKVVMEESSETGNGDGLLSKEQEKQHVILLIVTTMAVLAAIGIGFLAFDYKRRWEQEVVTQNQRLTGNANGSYSDLDSLEPDTLSFPQNFGTLSTTDVSDHSFRIC
ncbi:MAG: hypothetical protein LBJ67_10980 [Planctomycetaceae bacterium]|nr:hypothetical protein [Planctomycetaceae bacterium]